jgi:hypothetical protein
MEYRDSRPRAASGVFLGQTKERAARVDTATNEFQPVRRNRSMIRTTWAILGSLIVTMAMAPPSWAGPSPTSYVILGWNNLGMHCYNRDCADFLILPPYNTLEAQVIQVGDPPRIVTSGVVLDYNFPQNTYSAGRRHLPQKTNFWDYAEQIFGLTQELVPDIGLTGKGLRGTMDPGVDSFTAEGIPLTEYRDIDARGADPTTWNRYPFQLARLTLRDASSYQLLARNLVVAPVSSELSCDMCHSDTGDATTRYPITPTGKIETNILTLHDYLSAALYPPEASDLLMDSRPVLCAKCHSSNALGAAGIAGVSSLSNAMHNHHQALPDITPDTAGCYSCHPGSLTQCLRCTMSQDFMLNCTDCHGLMADVAVNPNPWLNEPRCDSTACHGAGYAMDQPLYRDSHGHGGVYCTGCHDSPHAIAKSREPNDAIKFGLLQKRSGTLRDCTICHATRPTTRFRHGPP